MIKLKYKGDEAEYIFGDQWYSMDDGQTWHRGAGPLPPPPQKLTSELFQVVEPEEGCACVIDYVDRIRGLIRCRPLARFSEK